MSRFHSPALAISILYHCPRERSVWDYRVLELEVILENELVQSLHCMAGVQRVETIGPGKWQLFQAQVRLT